MIDVDDRLLVFSGGSISGTACIWEFDDNDASVLCRQLGYGTHGTSYAVPRSSFPHVLFNVQCQGTEARLDECAYDTQDITLMCPGADDVGITCSTSTTTVTSQSSQGFISTTTVASQSSQGTSMPPYIEYESTSQPALNLVIDVDDRLLVLSGGSISGTACIWEFDDNDASVLCRQLGYGTSGTSYALSRSSFPHVLFNVQCQGTEARLDECAYDTQDITFMCPGADDVGITCSTSTTTVASQGHSTVWVGPGGRVFASTTNGTGTVCSDRWDDMDADVVCRQMGFPSGTASFLPRDYMNNHIIFNVRCQGNETNVQQCPVDEWDMFGNCVYHGDAGVNCMNTSQVIKSTFRKKLLKNMMYKGYETRKINIDLEK
ncbi:deleted in malignant brain tumors 1 protein-like [Saccostrea echinata]|uniref:deleted in malignant brain tumors 1 protein-like n=1 Tax=Saccostrea echinata TaxID=191078 RepID=UPI002A7F780C|nr:deleted in malignant brain tumors 1 protein-like [Saccostrea echinata]